MSDFAKKYHAVVNLAKMIRTAPRAGWVKPDSRSKANHAILVSRRKAEKVVDELAIRMYNGYVWMYEALNLASVLSQLAEGAEDAECCDVCGNTYRRRWMEGKCPCCEASKGAKGFVRQLLEVDVDV